MDENERSAFVAATQDFVGDSARSIGALKEGEGKGGRCNHCVFTSSGSDLVK